MQHNMFSPLRYTLWILLVLGVSCQQHVRSVTTSNTTTSTSDELSCPESNGASYTAADGKIFEVLCYLDDPGTALTMVYETTLTGCIQACDNATDCVGFSWVSNENGGSNPCYLKSAVGVVPDNSVWGGVLIYTPPVVGGNLSCPDSNGTVYTTSDNQTWEIQCYTDHSGGDFKTVSVFTLLECLEACDTADSCVAFSWASTENGDENPCYLKSTIGAATDSDSVWGGVLTTYVTPGNLSCPDSNGTFYTTSDNTTWEIQCYTDHSGGDLSTVYEYTLLECLEACDTTDTCVAFSWVSAQNGVHEPCYLKSEIGTATSNSGVWGGVVISSSS